MKIWAKASRKKASISAKRTWADPVIRKRRKLALKKANSKRTKEHAMKLGLAHRGIKASRKTKKKMSDSHYEKFENRSSEQCEMCCSFKHTTEQHKERASAGRRKSKIWKTAVLEANKRRDRTVTRFGQYYYGENRKVWMRSSYEVKFADWLDKKEIEWEYEPKHFYVGKGPWSGLNYTPDFYLTDHGLYVETKGWLREEDEQKLQEFHKLYPEVAKEHWVMLAREGLLALKVIEK